MPKDTDHIDLLKEVQIQTLRGSGPGGQHRNKVETAVRIVHIPTGITVTASEHRSQLRNKKLALERLQTRLDVRNKKPKPRVNTRPHRAAIEKRLKKNAASRKKNAGGRSEIGTNSPFSIPLLFHMPDSA